jgi:hypothetical protein
VDALDAQNLEGTLGEAELSKPKLSSSGARRAAATHEDRHWPSRSRSQGEASASHPPVHRAIRVPSRLARVSRRSARPSEFARYVK